MIACPVCAGPTRCVETRHTKYGTRRRRECRNFQCAGRVSTVECIVEPGSRLNDDSPMTMVNTSDLRAMKKRITAVLDMAAIKERLVATLGDET